MDSLDVLTYPNDVSVRDIILSTIKQRWNLENTVSDDAFLVGNLGNLFRATLRWKKCIPRVKPFYAIKSNSDPAILKFMSNMDVGFDCASKNEIKSMISLGVDPSRIIYSHTRKQLSHLRYAKSVGVNLTIFDSETELENIKQIHPDAKLLIRISTASCGTMYEPEFVLKFGCPAEDFDELLTYANNLKLNVIGVHFHAGFGRHDPHTYANAIQLARTAFDVGRRIGFTMSLLDIGGGFPSDCKNDYENCSFDEVASIVNDALDQHFPDGSGTKIIAEPGCYFSMTSCYLAANIIGKSRLKRQKANVKSQDANSSVSDKGLDMEYYMNDGHFSSCTLHFVSAIDPVPKPVNPKYDGKPELATRIWGQTCTIDLVCKRCSLPEMEMGDWIYFEDMGAYTYMRASTFNGFPIPKVHWYISEADRLEYEKLIQAKKLE